MLAAKLRRHSRNTARIVAREPKATALPTLRPAVANKSFLQNLRAIFTPERKYYSGQTFSLLNFPIASRRWWRTDLTAQEIVAHELVFRCLQKISDAVMDAQPAVEQAKRDKTWEAIDHPMTRRLMAPNADQSWPEFISSLTIDEQVWGRWYCEIIRTRSEGIAALIPLDVRAVTEVGERGESWGLSEFWDAGMTSGRVVSYRVTDAYQTRDVKPENMIAFHLFDRRSPLAGLSPVRVALNAAGVDASLNRYADTYLSKGGPAGLLSIKNKRLTQTQAEELQERWHQNYKVGGAREGRIAVLDEDGAFQAIGGHLGDLGNDTWKQHAQAAICGSLGVPPILAGAFVGLRWSNQKAGQLGAQRDMWDNKISPTLARYRHVFDNRVLSLYEDPAIIGVRLRTNWNLEQVAALREDVDLAAKRARDDYTAGVATLNEARTARGYKPIEGGDVVRNQPQQADDPNADDQSDKPKKKEKEIEREVKAYDFNGLKLARKPTPEEEQIVGVVAEAQDAALARIEPILTEASAALIVTAAQGIGKLTGDYQKLALTLGAQRMSELHGAVETGVFSGRASVAATLDSDSIESGEGDGEIAREIVNVASSAMSVAVGARFVSGFLRRLMRGTAKADAIKQTQAEMLADSRGYVTEIATGAAYQAIGDGRKAEMIARKKPGDRFIYSAILDTNTCANCKAVDLKESTNLEDLPDCPNVDCEGRWRCRCQIVIARD